ncbi:hypothetical protein FQN54_000903 [Arachnomyces sp. PD_36]|nr:hypothetical protein FQN54_000903 [Arachnomyces sp. PD_36]
MQFNKALFAAVAVMVSAVAANPACQTGESIAAALPGFVDGFEANIAREGGKQKRVNCLYDSCGDCHEGCGGAMGFIPDGGATLGCVASCAAFCC